MDIKPPTPSLPPSTEHDEGANVQDGVFRPSHAHLSPRA